eukprot:5149380-Alexandrium_andersonii.AAC.1
MPSRAASQPSGRRELMRLRSVLALVVELVAGVRDEDGRSRCTCGGCWLSFGRGGCCGGCVPVEGPSCVPVLGQ